MQEYLGQLRTGLNTARIHTLCLYHLSKVLNKKVVVHAPHLSRPAVYAWDATLDNEVEIAWVHKAQHGGLNHFQRVRFDGDTRPRLQLRA